MQHSCVLHFRCVAMTSIDHTTRSQPPRPLKTRQARSEKDPASLQRDRPVSILQVRTPFTFAALFFTFNFELSRQCSGRGKFLVLNPQSASLATGLFENTATQSLYFFHSLFDDIYYVDGKLSTAKNAQTLHHPTYFIRT